MFSECYILHWGGKKRERKKKTAFHPYFFLFSSSFRRETIWKANLGSLWQFNLRTNWFLSSFFQIVAGHQWMPRQLLACLIPLIKGHCGSKTETNGFFILHLSALQSNGTGSPPRVFLFRCILSPFNKVFLFFFLKEREWMRGEEGIQSHFLSPFCVSGRSEIFFFLNLN